MIDEHIYGCRGGLSRLTRSDRQANTCFKPQAQLVRSVFFNLFFPVPSLYHLLL